MKGTTHLAIGVAIGAVAAASYPFTLKNASLYITVAAFSALAADLDGPSLLSGKLGPVSKLLRELIVWSSLALVAVIGYLYFAQRIWYPELAMIAVVLLLLGFIAKEGFIRNALVSLIGAALLVAGAASGTGWLMGFGLFVAWVPWLKHRGMTHTVWAIIVWGAIGQGLENYLQTEGIMAVSIYGYLSHLLADSLTPNGVKWLYPLYKKPIKLMH